MSEPEKVMEYVVQMASHVPSVIDTDGDPRAGYLVWQDIATVQVPPRTKRKTIIQKALAEAGITPSEDGSKPRLRALDAESAEVFEPQAHQPEPEWRL